MLCSLILCLPLLAAPPVTGDRIVVVSARAGDDSAGEGTAAAPFRTLTRALREAGAGTTLRIDYGEYGPGEVFPLEVPAGTRLIGRGSTLSTVRGGEGQTLLRVATGAEGGLLQGLGLQGGAVGLVLTGPAAAEGEAPAAPVLLNDVRFAQLTVGLELPEAPGSRDLDARALRFEDCDTGMVVRTAARVQLGHCVFQRNRHGLALVAGTEGAATRHDLTVHDCQFLDQVESGVHREGAGANESPTPMTFERCLFRGNDTGLHFAIPAGDAAFLVRDCEFLENVHHGIRAVGRDPEDGPPSVVEDCTFRWNGIGAYLVNLRRGLRMQRCRVLHSLGAGVFCANFLGEDVRATLVDCLLADNGAAGLLLLADGDTLRVSVHHCTVVANAGSGVSRKDKHGGATSLDVRGCILAGNTYDDAAVDLWHVEPGEVHGCLIASGWQDGVNGNFAADPGFVDATRLDYRLRDDSPARGRGEGELPDLGANHMAADG